MPPYSFWLKTSKLPVEELQAQGAGVGPTLNPQARSPGSQPTALSRLGDRVTVPHPVNSP